MPGRVPAARRPRRPRFGGDVLTFLYAGLPPSLAFLAALAVFFLPAVVTLPLLRRVVRLESSEVSKAAGFAGGSRPMGTCSSSALGVPE